MRILIITHKIPPYCGGAEHVAWYHAKYLGSNDDVHVMTLGDKGGTESRDGVTIHYLPNKRHVIRFYYSNGKSIIRKIFNDINPDVIHEHMPGIFGYVLRNESVVKVGTFHHGTEEQHIEDTHESPSSRIKRHFLWRGILKRFDAMTTVSRWHANYCSRQYGREVLFVPNGVDIQKYHVQDNVAPQKDTILYFGRLKIRKGVDKLLETTKLLNNYKFLFTGSGHLSNKIRGNNVQYLGFVDDLVKTINDSSLCIFPSIWENWPLVGLEAMACGKPVIATPRGFSEYITHEEDGFIIPDNNPLTIKNAIVKLMGDDEYLLKMGKNARKTAEKYDWGQIVIRYRELYKKILEKSYP